MTSWGAHHEVTKGHAWAYYVFENAGDAASEWKVTISTNTSRFNVYASFGAHANPNRFNHEMKFLKVPANKGLELTDK